MRFVTKVISPHPKVSYFDDSIRRETKDEKFPIDERKRSIRKEKERKKK